MQMNSVKNKNVASAAHQLGLYHVYGITGTVFTLTIMLLRIKSILLIDYYHFGHNVVFLISGR